MGFRDLEIFNFSLFVKQGWRILEQPDAVVARMLKAKCFSNSSFLECSLRNGVSYAWRSIWEAQILLKEGI